MKQFMISDRNLHERVEKLTQDIEKYDKLAESQRLGSIFSELNKDMKSCQDTLSEYEEILENAEDVDTEPDPDKDNDLRFEERLAKIEKLYDILVDNELTIDERISVYEEVAREVKWCKEYLKLRTLEVEKKVD